MDNIKTFVVTVFAVAVVLFGASLLKTDSSPKLGATFMDSYNPVSFRSGITVGGYNFATSSVGAVTYTGGTFNNPALGIITHTAASALTATLPASTTLTSLVPNIGDSRVIYINPITTGMTLAGGTGTLLNSASSTKFIIAGQVGRLEFVRKANSDINVFMTTGSY